MTIDTTTVQGIADRMVLTTLNTGAWRPTRLHKQETRNQRQRHHTNAVRSTLTLTEHPLFGDIARLHAEAYAAHRALTLPTIQDGVRVLATGKQLEHSDAMRDLASRHDKLVAQVRDVYISEKVSAPARHNGLYDPTLWPSADYVVAAHHFATRYLPCPTDGAWSEWLVESAAAATAELRERLQQAIDRMAERCSADGRLHETVWSGLTEIARLVPDYDFDGKLKAVAEAAAKLTAEHAVDAVRDSDTLKAKVAARAADLGAMLRAVE